MAPSRQTETRLRANPTKMERGLGGEKKSDNPIEMKLAISNGRCLFCNRARTDIHPETGHVPGMKFDWGKGHLQLLRPSTSLHFTSLLLI
jgi:hypothetical protein